eukprot:6187190-Pleurochrysis_carterae.AAC.1
MHPTYNNAMALAQTTKKGKTPKCKLGGADVRDMPEIFAMIRSWGNLRSVRDICRVAWVTLYPGKCLGHSPRWTKSAET